MKLIYFRDKIPNFGDELNLFLWEKLLPRDFLDDDERNLFLGIGSILWDNFSKDQRKCVVGSGYGRYTGVPDVHDGSWDIVFVRGPRTAQTLGLPASKAICDGAVLLRKVQLPSPQIGVGVAFMPHYQSLERGHWRDVCRHAQISLIDPTDSVESIIARIRGADMLITEAMHGAIVADALRTPWVAVQPIHPEHSSKWDDWAESLGIKLVRHRLQPSGVLELYIAQTQGERYYHGRATQWGRSALAAPANRVLISTAARHLRILAKFEPQLSRDDAICGVTNRAADAVDQFVRFACGMGIKEFDPCL